MRELRVAARISEYEDDFPLLYKAASKNFFDNYPGRDISMLQRVTVNDFTWRVTIEGHEFWKYVYNGQLKYAMEMIPEYFIESAGNVIKNGFFNKLKSTV